MKETIKSTELMIKELEDNLQLEIDKALNNPLGNMSAKVK